MRLLRRVHSYLPPRTRETIKYLMGAAGHKTSWLDGARATDHAKGKKRLDRVAADLGGLLQLAKITSLEGQECLEFGAGFCPTEAVVFSLLGASRIVATDYNPIARIESLHLAAARSDEKKMAAALAPFEPRQAIAARVSSLMRNPSSAGSDVSYLAPHDMSAGVLAGGKFDFIHSISVLEHLPLPLVAPILQNLAASLKPGGIMIHEIDLRDHLDMRKPLAFLAQESGYDPLTGPDHRGNRLRRSGWMKLFYALPGTRSKIIVERRATANVNRKHLHQDYAALHEDDLAVLWIAVMTVREH